MSVKEMVKKEVDRLPASLVKEVLDFIQSIERKNRIPEIPKVCEKLPEASFAKAWDKEDQPWTD